MIRVLVVASLEETRARIRRLVASLPAGVLVAGEAATAEAIGSEAIDVVVTDDERMIASIADRDDTMPVGVVVLDDGRGAGAARRLRALAVHGWAVVPADASPQMLGASIAAAAAGLATVPAGARGVAGSNHTTIGRDEAAADRLQEQLTPREREVLDLMSRGLSNEAIAERLDISPHTAKFHVASILQKLGASNRTDAVRRAVRRGLVTL